MRDEERDQPEDEETGPGTPLHAYAEGREEDVEGDLDKLTSGDPNQLQRDEVEADESSSEHIEPPPKA